MGKVKDYKKRGREVKTTSKDGSKQINWSGMLLGERLYKLKRNNIGTKMNKDTK